eukprot:1172862-Pyramimonas_sp.AAC.1
MRSSAAAGAATKNIERKRMLGARPTERQKRRLLEYGLRPGRWAHPQAPSSCPSLSSSSSSPPPPSSSSSPSSE